MEMWSRTLFLLVLFAFPALHFESRGTSGLAFAADEEVTEEATEPDVAEGEEEEEEADEEDEVEDEEATVESEDEEGKTDTTSGVVGTEEDDEDEVDDGSLKSSPDADATILFVKPGPSPTSILAGKLVRFHVGFTNKGEKEFLVDSLEASFRYPQDFSFHIQNFSMVSVQRVVEPKRQATFDYAFTPSESFAGRPFGLVVNLNYKDEDGNVWQNAVFNETVTVNEADEGLDGETFFLYLFLIAVVVLLLVAGQQFLASFSRKHLGTGGSSSKPSVDPGMEMGTQNGGLSGANGDVDMSWIPSQNLVALNNSGSPRQRKAGKRRED